MGQPEYLFGGLLLIFLALVLPDIRKKKKGSGEPSAKPEHSRLLELFSPVSREKKMLRYPWKTNLPRTKLAREILWFTGGLLHEKGIRHFPSIEIRYYKKKNIAGFYCGRNHQIVVYLKNHSTIPEIVDTVLHEVCHYMQNKGNEKEFKRYDDYTLRYGYHDNPLEVESRAFARKWTVTCLEHLYKKQIIF